MNFFQQFVFNRAGVARTGEPVNLPQGGQHVPSRGDVLPQEAQHVLGVEDVRVPGFCRTQGTHLFYTRRLCQTVHTSNDIRSDGLLNHISNIFGPPQPVQGQHVPGSVQPGVELAQEAFPTGPQVPVTQPCLGSQVSQRGDPVRDVPALVPQQGQPLLRDQGVRGAQPQDSVRARQDSVFRSLLVKTPHPGFVKVTTASDWFASTSHVKGSVAASKTSTPASLPASSSSTTCSGVSSSNLVGAVSQDQGESVASCSVDSRNKIINDLVHDSLSQGTRKLYQLHYQLFKNFGQISGINVSDFNFDFNFVCQYLLMRFQESHSISSVKTSRSMITFYWKLNSSLPCPTESPFVSMFIKGLCKRFQKAPNKSYPISFEEISKIFDTVVGDSSLEDLSLVTLRFLAFIITSYASFARYEEVVDLKISNIVREDHGFVLTFTKGKTYAIGESNIGIVSNLPGLKYNPSDIFSLYLDKVAYTHATSDSSSDYLFPSLRSVGGVTSTLDKPASYQTFLKAFKIAVKSANIPVGLSKVGLHSLRRGGVTHAVRAGAPHDVVQKCMRVKSASMVAYYASLTGKELHSAAKLAF